MSAIHFTTLLPQGPHS